MKKKLLFIILSLLVVFVAIYFITQRTPYKVAEIISEFEINQNYEVEYFEDDWDIMGDGINVIVFKLNDKHIIKELSAQCVKKQYLKLPIDEELPLNTVYNYINVADSSGYYKLVVEDDGISYNIVVVDLTKNKLVVVNETF